MKTSRNPTVGGGNQLLLANASTREQLAFSPGIHFCAFDWLKNRKTTPVFKVAAQSTKKLTLDILGELVLIYEY
ncbi:hypothetical protein L915_02907 [Phytophthora nicotianae]|uniref:Uncharacterized protein n=1 Tax=Phytophthora nicotianae TaxID=4792 RepID=W2HHN1_PHYNI|nr:hypothetical protein L915_02907 [Phytophthora nicotianae]ETL47364.1 hypothetical protein L916_02884 [Phytophthora nicotianae]